MTAVVLKELSKVIFSPGMIGSTIVVNTTPAEDLEALLGSEDSGR